MLTQEELLVLVSPNAIRRGSRVLHATYSNSCSYRFNWHFCAWVPSGHTWSTTALSLHESESVRAQICQFLDLLWFVGSVQPSWSWRHYWLERRSRNFWMLSVTDYHYLHGFFRLELQASQWCAPCRSLRSWLSLWTLLDWGFVRCSWRCARRRVARFQIDTLSKASFCRRDQSQARAMPAIVIYSNHLCFQR